MNLLKLLRRFQKTRITMGSNLELIFGRILTEFLKRLNSSFTKGKKNSDSLISTMMKSKRLKIKKKIRSNNKWCRVFVISLGSGSLIAGLKEKPSNTNPSKEYSPRI